MYCMYVVFFVKQKTAYEMRISDWSSDVCSSDLTLADFAAVKVKNAAHGFSNPNARYRKKFTAEDVAASAMLADPLRLMDVCAVSDGAAALIVSSVAYASRIGKASAPRVAAISPVTPSFASALVAMLDIATDRSEESRGGKGCGST